MLAILIDTITLGGFVYFGVGMALCLAARFFPNFNKREKLILEYETPVFEHLDVFTPEEIEAYEPESVTVETEDIESEPDLFHLLLNNPEALTEDEIQQLAKENKDAIGRGWNGIRKAETLKKKLGLN